jgi:hypothetical protein
VRAIVLREMPRGDFLEVEPVDADDADVACEGDRLRRWSQGLRFVLPRGCVRSPQLVLPW